MRRWLPDAVEQVSWEEPECPRYSGEDAHTRITARCLKTSNLRGIHTSTLGERFLRQTLPLASSA